MTIPTKPTAPVRLVLRRMAALLALSAVGPLQAAPAAPQVVAGQASFVQQGNVFSITNTPNTVINWQSFNIGAGEITRFIQQSSSSAVLNRIVGQDPSQILGALQSNGHVFLINPNGILFGRDSRVDVNGLTASTLGISNADFLAGKNNFAAGTTSGQIVNQGSISTPSGGKVFLLASNVSNSGIITSPQGQVVLAAGHTVQLVDPSNPDLHVVVSAPAQQAVNLGQIISQGGRVGIYGALVNQRGVVNADSAQIGENGKIVLRASREALLEAGSLTSANGAGNGGSISVQGERVGMTGNARIEASGATGGGSVLLGGGYQGKNPMLGNAQQTLLGKNASITADATGSGNGGTVVLWGEASTRALGRISARGGALAGNGGLVETSGKYLDVNGVAVDAGARKGISGTWLLDPTDINVVGTAGAPLGDVDQFADPGTMSLVDANTISSVAPGTNVVLQATHDITFSQAISPNLGNGSLTVDAGNHIMINAPISTGGGALKLTANHPAYASGSGMITMGPGSAIDTGGGELKMSGYQVNLDGPLLTGGGKLSIDADTQLTIAKNISTGNGDLSMSGGSIQFDGSGNLADSGLGKMFFKSGMGPFVLGPTWTLRSADKINLVTNSATLQGAVGPSQSVRPVLSITTINPGKDLDLNAGPEGSSLQLDPSWLAAQDVAALFIGAPDHTGNINVYKDYIGGLADKLTLNTSGNITVYKPLSLGTGKSLELLLDGGNSAGTITTMPDTGMGAPIPGGRLSADNVILRANNMKIGASITGTGPNGGNVALMPHTPSALIHIGVGATDSNDLLGLDDTELARISTGALTIGGNPGQGGAIDVMPSGMDWSAILASNSKLMIDAGMGQLTLRGKLSTPGELFLKGSQIDTDPGMLATASAIRFSSTNGIGARTGPFHAQTSYLAAANQMAGGVEPINISNTGTLNLGSVHQTGTGNQGSISISNAGGMTLLAGESVLTGGTGNIQLKTQSPLTIHGAVATDVGAINLEAGNGGLLTIGAAGVVSSNAGQIGLVAGDIVNDGNVSTTTGNINISTTTVTGNGAFHAPGGTVTGLPPPTLTQCIANPGVTGCTTVLKAALDACIADPSGTYCSALLPTLATCIAAPTTYGCIAVLPTLPACIADPGKPGCVAVLPTLPACIADPSTPGCVAVLPTLPACIVNPATPGCVAVLPTMPACIANPSTPGCVAVLPTLPACIVNPSTPGCAAVLPTLPACIANPSTPGCVVVLPTLPVCIADPGKPGCVAVLPTLPACIVNPSTPGCIAVLPTLPTCIADPGKPGCVVVLPTLPMCIVNPSTPGCVVVLPTLPACIADPSKTGCNVVLPTLAVCIAAPSSPGCAAVLPTLSACVANPAAAGCSVVLPPLAVCIANPSVPACSVVLPSLALCQIAPATAGCSAVLPTSAQCVANPNLAGCVALTPSVPLCLQNPGEPACQLLFPVPAGVDKIGTALNANVAVMDKPPGSAAPANAGDPPAKPGDAKKEEKKDVVEADKKPGVKNDVPVKKTYCN